MVIKIILYICNNKENTERKWKSRINYTYSIIVIVFFFFKMHNKIFERKKDLINN